MSRQVLNMIGPNELTPPPTDPAWKLFLKELLAPLNLMLICASAMCILVSRLAPPLPRDTPRVCGRCLFSVVR